MSYPVIEPRETESDSSGHALAVVFPAIFFVLGLALFTVAFNVDEWGPWVFAGGLLSMTLAFAIPTTILPALEDR
jgi:hypothetical protein